MNTLSRITAAGAVKRSTTIDLGDCDDTYRGATFDVWVTPTRAHLEAWNAYVAWLREEPARREAERDAIQDEAERAEFDAAMGDALDREMWRRLDAWLADTWLNIEPDEVTQIREHLQENHPAAWDWLYTHTLRTMNEYREHLTKN